MTSRTRFLTMALGVCHLFVLVSVVTSRLHAQVPAAQAAPGAAPSRFRPHRRVAERATSEATIEALRQEKVGDVYRLTGDVQITYSGFVLRAQEVTYNAATGEAVANDRVMLDGGEHHEHLEAARATYNIRTQVGVFQEVRGTTGMRFRGSSVQLTSASPFYFQGKRVEKAGRDRIIVHNGSVTSCELPNPKWVFAVEKADVVAGDEARLYHSTFRLLGLPVFYLPYLQHPVNSIGRESGFLIPTIGQSSRRGTILGESFYWAINRSMDTTVGAEYFSRRGWAQHGSFRSRPSRQSFLNADYYGVLDRGTGTPRTDQGGQDVHLNGEVQLPHDTRAVADIEYLSSFVFRLAFAQSFTQAVNSEVRSNAFISKIQNGFFFNLRASRYQNFQSTTRGDLITLVRAPSLDLNSVEHRVGTSPFHWSYDVALESVSRSEPNFVTKPMVGRVDAFPRLSLPLFLRGWSLRAEGALRDTYYTQSRTAVAGPGQVADLSVNRRAMEGSFELRPPSLSRIFERKVFDRTLKHTIEPRLNYRFVTGVDNATRIIRFDWRDILSNTNEVEYAIVNRIYSKSSHPDTNCEPERTLENTYAPAGEGRASLEMGLAGKGSTAETCSPGVPIAREILRWEVAQKTFLDETFGGALVAGQRNVFTTTEELTGIAFLTEPRRFSPIVSRLRIETSRNTDLQWNLDYDVRMGRISASTAIASLRHNEFFLAGSHAFLRTPGEVFVSTPTPSPSEFNQFRWLVGYGSPNDKRGLSVAGNIGFDVFERFLQYSGFQSSYNWDCCGVSFEYRRFALGSVRNENQFRFSLSLTNVGTFGNMRRQERLF